MSRPDDATMASATAAALSLEAVPRPVRREVLRASAGRAVERLEFAGRAAICKWRDDRPNDREAVLYRGLRAPVLAALDGPHLLGCLSAGGVHLLFLEPLEGSHPDWDDPAHVRRTFGHLGRLHRRTARMLEARADAFADATAWAELRADGYPDDGVPGEPWVLDPGDLHAENFLLQGGGRVRLMDFENMAVRPRRRALRQLREDRSLPQGPMAILALYAYWQAAGWPGPADPALLPADAGPPGAGP